MKVLRIFYIVPFLLISEMRTKEKLDPCEETLPSECGKHKTVRTRIWPWLSDKTSQTLSAVSFSAAGTQPGHVEESVKIFRERDGNVDT